jgi:hypothetical protein
MADIVDLDEIDPQIVFDKLADLNGASADRYNEKNSSAKTGASGDRGGR